MKKTVMRNIYIDGANLHRAALELGFDIDYKKFRGWLRQKYNPSNIYIFLGYMRNHQNLYLYLERCNFILIFKETIAMNSEIKGNCDAELVLKVVSDFYKEVYSDVILITGDGDFACLVHFLKENNIPITILAPSIYKCSFLLRKIDIPITFLNDHYHKFSRIIEKEKTPNMDVSI